MHQQRNGIAVNSKYHIAAILSKVSISMIILLRFSTSGHICFGCFFVLVVENESCAEINIKLVHDYSMVYHISIEPEPVIATYIKS